MHARLKTYSYHVETSLSRPNPIISPEAFALIRDGVFVRLLRLPTIGP